MKNDIFNLKRFGKYFVSDLKSCGANYGLSLMTVCLLAPVMVYVVISALHLITTSTWDGPDMGIRCMVFIMSMLCMIITMPVKCYGKITEKQYGSFWLTLPASRLEKFISMIVMTSIIVPVIGTVAYLCIDSVICALDHTCGRNLIAGAMELMRNLGEMKEATLNLGNESITIENAAVAQRIVSQITNPWIYVDEIFSMTLPFLLGAVFFKNGKTAKTFLSIFAFSIAISILTTPFMESWASAFLSNPDADPAEIIEFFNNSIFNNLAVIDTVSDTIVNTALLSGIWFRIKTLKH